MDDILYCVCLLAAAAAVLLPENHTSARALRNVGLRL